ncbi:MAG: HAD-IA family hydrolase [Piscinibacter sp.]|nr:HAD-IA family hydrolase [Piscinibacter sp.]
MIDALRPVRAVAFDLDGTLIDSAPDIQHALNAALKKEGLPRFDLDQVRAWIGDGPDMLIARALAALGRAASDAEADRDLRVRLRRSFDVATLAAPLSLGTVYAGIEPLLEALRPHLPMVVVTNKPTPLSRAVLEAAGLRPFVVAVHGGDEPAQRKPAPDLLLAAARSAGVQPNELLMVGDSALDLRAAQAAGCPAVLAAWGYGAHALPDGLVRWRAETPADLQQALLAARPAGERLTHD